MTELKCFNLNDISIPNKFLIFGNNGNNYQLMSIIKHVLNNTDCITSYVNIHENMCIKYCSKKYAKTSYVIVYDTIDCHPETFDPLDTIFINSQYINKESIMKKFFGKNYVNNLINYSCPETFFVLQNKNIPKIYKVENHLTYSIEYGANPYYYNNIIKLKNIILNNYSVYHKINDLLHIKIEFRLKQLNKIYFSIFCVRNNKLWLPNELNLEIIKLLFLLHL